MTEINHMILPIDLNTKPQFVFTITILEGEGIDWKILQDLIPHKRTTLDHSLFHVECSYSLDLHGVQTLVQVSLEENGCP